MTAGIDDVFDALRNADEPWLEAGGVLTLSVQAYREIADEANAEERERYGHLRGTLDMLNAITGHETDLGPPRLYPAPEPGLRDMTLWGQQLYLDPDGSQ